jgi:hypothetical protein
LPFWVRYKEGKPVASFDSYGVAYTVLENLSLSFILYINYLFVFAGLIDFQRRVFYMKACGALITPLKNQYDVPF